jgi:hypothetical protein
LLRWLLLWLLLWLLWPFRLLLLRFALFALSVLRRRFTVLLAAFLSFYILYFKFAFGQAHLRRLGAYAEDAFNALVYKLNIHFVYGYSQFLKAFKYRLVDRLAC